MRRHFHSGGQHMSIDTDVSNITPSLSRPWVLVRFGKAPPALAYLTYQTHIGTSFVCDVIVAELNSTTGLHNWRKRFTDRSISASDVLHVFPGAPSPYDVTKARRALRRKQPTSANV
jgi:hypothetical protein